MIHIYHVLYSISTRLLSINLPTAVIAAGVNAIAAGADWINSPTVAIYLQTVLISFPTAVIAAGTAAIAAGTALINLQTVLISEQTDAFEVGDYVGVEVFLWFFRREWLIEMGKSFIFFIYFLALPQKVTKKSRQTRWLPQSVLLLPERFGASRPFCLANAPFSFEATFYYFELVDDWGKGLDVALLMWLVESTLPFLYPLQILYF